MSEYIRKDKAIEATWFEPSYTDPLNVLTEARDKIESIDRADVRENIHARWKLVNPLQSDDGGAYVCSNCGTGDWGINPKSWKACPWCMAVMDKPE